MTNKETSNAFFFVGLCNVIGAGLAYLFNQQWEAFIKIGMVNLLSSLWFYIMYLISTKVSIKISFKKNDLQGKVPLN